jgi:putative methyltransferase (TIGR04325 family)
MHFHRIQIARVRATSALMRQLTRLTPLASLVRRLRRLPLARQAVNLAAGYNRVFSDLAAARDCARKYAAPGHGSDENARALSRSMAKTRPSDYPVLFHLSRLPLEGLRVFDLGGAMGNLFFLYDRYLGFPTSLHWTVHDVPAHIERGRDLARQRCESRLQFSDNLHGASGCDLLLVSGALHYFELSLADYLAGLAESPRHVIVNRTPLVDAPAAATVQCGSGGVMVACLLLNRAELIERMEKRGYRVVDSWSAPEFSIPLPYDREYWVKEYTGIYFRRDES